MSPSSTAAEAALTRRLATVCEVLGMADQAAHDGPAEPFNAIVALVEALQASPDPAAVWLFVVGITGGLPTPSVVRAVQRAVVLKDTENAIVWLLDTLFDLAIENGTMEASLRVVSNRPLVDVNLTAKSDFLTGIQRVVRGVAAQWSRRQDVELVVWAERDGAYRALTAAERTRVAELQTVQFDPTNGSNAEDTTEIVVPWGVPVVLTEVPPSGSSDRLTAVAEFTDASLRLVGYDCIPVSSAETVPLAEPEKFGRYLELVKHSDRIAGISDSATHEFEGFVRALSAQGLPGPRVVSCPLPHTVPVAIVETDRGEVAADSGPDRPLIVCIGTVGRRKNQVALVEAAELLWREGLDFEVRILGHRGSERSPLAGLVSELQALGRPLTLETGVSDSTIVRVLARARCLVFPSLHEGFGLPVVEALSHDVPVITADFGSLSEVAEGHGGLLVDPEDVDALAVAMHDLLTDDDLHARLVRSARARPVRTWTEYADDLWTALLS